jgi:hypothetical protein
MGSQLTLDTLDLATGDFGKNSESLLPVAAEPMALVGGVNAAADAAQVRRGRLRLPSKRSSPPPVRLLRSSGSVEGGSSRPPMRPT